MHLSTDIEGKCALSSFTTITLQYNKALCYNVATKAAVCYNVTLTH